jgi:hypothetical protein
MGGSGQIDANSERARRSWHAAAQVSAPRRPFGAEAAADADAAAPGPQPPDSRGAPSREPSLRVCKGVRASVWGGADGRQADKSVMIEMERWIPSRRN